MKARLSIPAKTNTVANIVAEALLNVAPFVWLYLLNRYQGSESVAEFAVLGSLYAFGRSFIEFGMNNEAIAELAAGNRNAIVEITVLRLCLAAMLFVAYGVYSLFFNGTTNLLISLLPLIAVPFCVDWVFKAQQKSYVNVVAAGGGFALSFIPIIFLGVGVLQVLIAKLVWMSVYALALCVLLLRDEDLKNNLIFFFSIRKIISVVASKVKSCWSYALSSFVITGSQNLPILLVALWMGSSDAGYFSFFIKLYGVFLVFKYVMMVSFLPRLTRLFKERKNSAIAELVRNTVLGFLILFLLLTFIYYFRFRVFTLLGFNAVQINYLTQFTSVLMLAAMVSWCYTYLPSLLILQRRRISFLLTVSIGLFVSAGALLLFNFIDTLTLLNSAFAILFSEMAILVCLLCLLRQELLRWKHAHV